MLYSLELDALAALSPVKDLNLNVDVLIVNVVRICRINLRNVRITRTTNATYRKLVPVVTEYTVTTKPVGIVSGVCVITWSPRSKLVEVLYTCDIVRNATLIRRQTNCSVC